MNAASARPGWIENDGLRLRYLEWGSPTSPAIVMLHGLRSYAMTWDPVAVPLADRWRVIALDQRGRGESDWDPKRDYYTEAYVRDLQALVETLRLERFALLGHSMGGTTAYVYAARHPERLTGLVIEDIGPGSSANSQGAERIKRELRDTPSRFPDVSAATAFWRGQRPQISERALRSRVDCSLKDDGCGGLVWRHDGEGIAATRLAATPQQVVDLWPVIDAIRTQTLVLRGAHSDFFAAPVAREMARRNARIRFVEIPDATHYAHDDNLPAFEGALHPFLRGCI